MTREEAAATLKPLHDWLKGDSYGLTVTHEIRYSMLKAMDMAIAALREPALDENGLSRCGCGGKANIWPSDLRQAMVTAYQVGCIECAMTTVWVRGKQENAVKVWNTAMGWKGGAE